MKFINYKPILTAYLITMKIVAAHIIPTRKPATKTKAIMVGFWFAASKETLIWHTQNLLRRIATPVTLCKKGS